MFCWYDEKKNAQIFDYANIKLKKYSQIYVYNVLLKCMVFCHMLYIFE